MDSIPSLTEWDKVILHDINLKATIGPHQGSPQTILISVELFIPVNEAALSESASVDSGTVGREILQLVEGQMFSDLYDLVSHIATGWRLQSRIRLKAEDLNAFRHAHSLAMTWIDPSIPGLEEHNITITIRKLQVPTSIGLNSLERANKQIVATSITFFTKSPENYEDWLTTYKDLVQVRLLSYLLFLLLFQN